jgi:hypothetical protein
MTNTHTHAHSALAVSLVAGPTLFALGDTVRRVVDDGSGSSPTKITAAVEAHPSLWLSAALLEVLAALVTLPALAALIASARGRGRRTTIVGATLLGAGQVASVGHAVAFFAPYALYARAGTPAAEVRSLDRASESWPLLSGLIVLFMLGLVVGTLVMFVGLRMGRRVPLWAVVAALLFVVLGGSTGVVEGVLGVVAAAVAFSAAARSLARAPEPADLAFEPVPA